MRKKSKGLRLGEVGHPTDDFSFVPNVDAEFFEQGGVGPSFWGCTLIRAPVIDVPIGFVHQLVELLQFRFRHDAHVLLRKRAQE